jgi:hypothetical protein
MKLKEARELFHVLRTQNAIEVRRHAWRDHPERGFSPLELIRLVQGKGALHDNRYPSALPNSFLWLCRDDEGRKTEVAILFERNERGQFILVVHAYRDVRG